MLRNFLNEFEFVPWESLSFVTGDINYGGRVTDDFDRLLLLCTLKKYYNPEILEEGYRFSESGIYYAPHLTSIFQYREFIEKLPSDDPPEVFGMHENSNLLFKLKESSSIISIILDIQPRVSGKSDAKSSDEIILDLVAELQGMVPELIDPKE